jgi:hypothetical protein
VSRPFPYLERVVVVPIPCVLTYVLSTYLLTYYHDTTCHEFHVAFHTNAHAAGALASIHPIAIAAIASSTRYPFSLLRLPYVSLFARSERIH